MPMNNEVRNLGSMRMYYICAFEQLTKKFECQWTTKLEIWDLWKCIVFVPLDNNKILNANDQPS